MPEAAWCWGRVRVRDRVRVRVRGYSRDTVRVIALGFGL
jgi:hypothetical protein